jgi:hypothetical protein
MIMMIMGIISVFPAPDKMRVVVFAFFTIFDVLLEFQVTDELFRKGLETFVVA